METFKLMMQKWFGHALFAGLMLVPTIALSDSLEERIKPVGDTCMAGDECAASVASASSEPTGARDGKTVYATKCFICHDSGMANSPKIGDAADWGARIEARTLEGLYKSGISGFNGMPPKGTCMDCSDDEIKAAIDHILENSK